MDSSKVDMFILSHSKNFKSGQIPFIRQQLLNVNDDRWIFIQSASFHDPIVSLIISLFFGYLGIDRMLIGDVGLGVLKLVTCGGFGIWTVVDWFLIFDATKDKNIETLQKVIM